LAAASLRLNKCRALNHECRFVIKNRHPATVIQTGNEVGRELSAISSRVQIDLIGGERCAPVEYNATLAMTAFVYVATAKANARPEKAGTNYLMHQRLFTHLTWCLVLGESRGDRRAIH
jgi:hypothetical protein